MAISWLLPVYAAIFASLMFCSYITFKMFMLGRRLDFINSFTIWLLVFELTAGSAMNVYHFKVGFTNLFSEDFSLLVTINEDCTIYVNFWIAFWTITGVSHAGVIFCRYIFVRYPEGLLVEGKSYLKTITVVFVSFYSFMTMLYHTPLIRKEDFIPNTLKGLICVRQEWDLTDEEFRKVSSIKPKLIMCMSSFFFGFYIVWMFRFSRRHSKKFKIPKYRRHLYTMTSQSVITTCIAIGIISDQLLNLLIELNYQRLGPNGAFILWWTWKLLENLFYFVIKNVWLLYIVVKHPEVCRLEGRYFPGQEKPRTMMPEPKKPIALKNFEPYSKPRNITRRRIIMVKQAAITEEEKFAFKSLSYI